MGMQRTIRMEYPERIICLLLQHGQQSLSARVWIFGAKIMQTRAMKTCFQIAECSLSYAKLATFSQNNSLSTQNLSKNACFYSFSIPRCQQHGGCQHRENVSFDVRSSIFLVVKQLLAFHLLHPIHSPAPFSFFTGVGSASGSVVSRLHS